MRAHPTITVAVPCHNYGRFLGDCLAALQKQEGVILDIVVIDDCSKDDTPMVVAAYATHDPRIRYVRHTENRGFIKTFNECIQQARSTYFSIVSADDVMTPGALARACYLMEDHPNVGLVYGGVVQVDEYLRRKEGRFRAGQYPVKIKTKGRAVIYPGAHWIRQASTAGRNFIIGSEAVLRTSVQQAAGLYDEWLGATADTEMWLRVAALADVAYLSVDQMLYRVHPASLMRTVHAGWLFDLNGRFRSFKSAYEKGALTRENFYAADKAITKQRRWGEKGDWLDRLDGGRLRYLIRRHTGITL